MLKNKVCFVTGASRGIGQAIAKYFSENGGIVYANARNENAILEWRNILTPEIQSRIIPAVCDIRQTDELKRIFVQIRKEHGRLDVCVNNAGIAFNEAIGMISGEHVKDMFQTNVFAMIECLQLSARLMMRQKSGSIINISSIVGVEGDAGQSAYSATKGAVIALTKSASKELAPYQVRVNSVAPGLTKTDLFEETEAHYLEKRISHIGMGRLAKPQDIAKACLFFASDLSEYVTGQVLVVSGGSIL